MTTVLPTTVHDLEEDVRSPCCDAQLVLVSPPKGYECRECYERYDLSDAAEGEEVCGAEMSNGSTCERPTDECPYHRGS